MKRVNLINIEHSIISGKYFGHNVTLYCNSYIISSQSNSHVNRIYVCRNIFLGFSTLTKSKSGLVLYICQFTYNLWISVTFLFACRILSIVHFASFLKELELLRLDQKDFKVLNC